MKKISRDERKGAVMLAVIVLCVVCAGFAFRSCDFSTNETDKQPVTIIYSDKEEDEGSSSGKSYYKKSGKKKSRKSGGSRKKGNSGKATRDERPPRDFLEDTIPTLYNN